MKDSEISKCNTFYAPVEDIKPSLLRGRNIGIGNEKLIFKRPRMTQHLLYCIIHQLLKGII